MAVLLRSRPCRSCHKWFRPSRGASDTQHFCAAKACQREGHRQACARWHRKNPNYDRETRLAKRLVKDVPREERQREPLASIDWVQARDDTGLETAVLVEEMAKVLVAWARETVRLQLAEIIRVMSRVPTLGAREAVGS